MPEPTLNDLTLRQTVARVVLHAVYVDLPHPAVGGPREDNMVPVAVVCLYVRRFLLVVHIYYKSTTS